MPPKNSKTNPPPVPPRSDEYYRQYYAEKGFKDKEIDCLMTRRFYERVEDDSPSVPPHSDEYYHKCNPWLKPTVPPHGDKYKLGKLTDAQIKSLPELEVQKLLGIKSSEGQLNSCFNVGDLNNNEQPDQHPSKQLPLSQNWARWGAHAQNLNANNNNNEHMR